MVSGILNVNNENSLLEVKQLDVFELQILYEAIVENIKVVDNLFSYKYKY